MENQICVREIVRMYGIETEHWCRSTSSVRTFDGIVLLTAGEIDYIFDQKTITARAGDVLLLPGNLPYSGICKSRKVAFFVIDFFCQTNDEIARFGAPCKLMENASPQIYADFSEANALWQRSPIDIDLRIKAFVYENLCKRFHVIGKKIKSENRSDKIIGYITEHIGDECLNVHQLCKLFFISESQLRREMKRITGLTPNKYIARLRMHKAQELLTNTEKPIMEIAAMCGFSNSNYFSQCFSEEYGISPRQFRERFREG